MPGRAGVWDLEEGTLCIWPQLACPVPSTIRLRWRLLRTADDARRTDLWQPLDARVVATPRPLPSPPKRLAPSLTWTDIAHFAPNATAQGKAHSLAMFRALGLTAVPTLGVQRADPHDEPSAGVLYSPAQRASDPAWKGLLYAPQISAFYRNYRDRYGYFGRLRATHATSARMHPSAAALMRTVGGLSERQIAREMATLNKSLDFFEATGNLDLAYDGWLVANALNMTRQLVEYMVPDFWWVDSELFIEWKTWLAEVGQSANAARRRRDGETDADLAYRISYEFMAAYNGTVANASKGKTTIGFFGAMAAQNIGMQSFPWSVLGRLGQAAQKGA